MAKSKQPKAPKAVVEKEPEANTEPPAADAVTDLSKVEKKAETERMTMENAVLTPVFDDYKAPAGVPLEQYNPATHFAVNKAHFSQLIVNLIAGRTKMYARGAMPSRLIELLDLKDTAEAQKVISDIYNKVAAGG